MADGGLGLLIVISLFCGGVIGFLIADNTADTFCRCDLEVISELEKTQNNTVLQIENKGFNVGDTLIIIKK